MKRIFKPFAVTAVLVFLFFSAFLIRSRNYLNTFPQVTVDEDVYYNLAENLSRNWREYNLFDVLRGNIEEE